MKKLIITAVAAAALLASSAAFAGYWTPYGQYVPTCGWVPGYYGPVYVCG